MREKEMKKNIIIFSVICVIVIGVFFTGISIFKNSKYEYSFSEKNWISNNSSGLIDISVPNDLPVFNSKGEGVYIDFIKNLEEDTKLRFNIIDSRSSYAFTKSDRVTDNDILLYKDHFVIVSSKGTKVKGLNDLSDKNVAVLSNNLSKVSNFLNQYHNITYTTYKDKKELKNAVKNQDSFAIVPVFEFLDEIISKEFRVSYKLDGLKDYYVLSMPKDGSKLNDVLSKFALRWNKGLENSLNNHIVKYYFENNIYTDVQKESIINNDFVVGYIKNLPIEGKINRSFTGITREYLNKFSALSGATFKYVEYDNLESLSKALNKKKIDLALNYYSIHNDSYDVTNNIGDIGYVVLANYKNDLVLNSLDGLKGYTVKSVENTNLTNLIKSNQINVETYSNYKKLIKSLNDQDILIVEKNIYDYYKATGFKNYTIRYMGNEFITANFLLKGDNQVFNELFKFYIDITNNDMIRINAVNNVLEKSNSNVVFGFVITNISYILVIAAAIITFIIIYNKKIKVTKKIRKEDRLMYLDVMTNLKNRNYLNDNIEYWESNKVFPQAVVIVDLNNINEINDTYGHEEGDAQIKAAANILIKTQRENSEIIRTDGNEFLIYLVGYEEKVIATYMRKLNKELANLPRNYGVSIGYSMIEDEIKSMDDAINEAIIMMKKNKGE